MQINYIAIPGIKHYDIQALVANKFDITKDQLTCRSRKRETALPRQVSMYMHEKRKERFCMSLDHIGEIHGGFDHATVIHAKKTVQNLIDTNKDFAAKIREIDGLING